MWSTNFNGFFPDSASYKLTKNDEIQYEFYFTITNALPENAEIVISFPISPKPASYCYSHLGLEDYSSS